MCGCKLKSYEVDDVREFLVHHIYALSLLDVEELVKYPGRFC